MTLAALPQTHSCEALLQHKRRLLALPSPQPRTTSFLEATLSAALLRTASGPTATVSSSTAGGVAPRTIGFSESMHTSTAVRTSTGIQAAAVHSLQTSLSDVLSIDCAPPSLAEGCARPAPSRASSGGSRPSCLRRLTARQSLLLQQCQALGVGAGPASASRPGPSAFAAAAAAPLDGESDGDDAAAVVSHPEAPPPLEVWSHRGDLPAFVHLAPQPEGTR